jgi:hypothetical protein
MFRMGVSINGGTPIAVFVFFNVVFYVLFLWNMSIYILQMDDLGVPPFQETSISPVLDAPPGAAFSSGPLAPAHGCSRSVRSGG